VEGFRDDAEKISRNPAVCRVMLNRRAAIKDAFSPGYQSLGPAGLCLLSRCARVALCSRRRNKCVRHGTI